MSAVIADKLIAASAFSITLTALQEIADHTTDIVAKITARQALVTIGAITPRFPNVSCSQCHQECGPGESGFSHCRDHASMVPQ